MAKRKLRVLSFLLALAMLCVPNLFGATTSVAAEGDTHSNAVYFSGGESSRMEMDADRMGLAFRFSFLAGGVYVNQQQEMCLDSAFVEMNGEKVVLSEVGVVLSNQTAVAEDESLLSLDHLSSKIIKIPVKYLLTLESDRLSFAVRVINVATMYQNTVVYARPYFVYENARGERNVYYGAMTGDNVSGKQRYYDRSAPDFDWTVGGLDVTTGDVYRNTKAVYSAYFNDLNMLARVPDDLSVRAFFYDEKGFVGSKLVSDWSVLSDLAPTDSCIALRLLVMGMSTQTTVKDASSFGAQLELRYAQRGDTLPVTFYPGGIVSADGQEENTSQRTRTKFIPLQDLLIEVSGDTRYQLYYYDENYEFLYATEGLDQTTRLLADPIKGAYQQSAVYIRVMAERGTDTMPNDKVYLRSSDVTLHLPQSETYLRKSPKLTPSVYAKDLPENQGVINTLLNFDQLIDIVFTPLKALPQKQGSLPAGKEQQGIPYSSTRPEALFVPNNVSLHTFMTALQNPNSYMYTVDLSVDYNNQNGKTYYGAVCSTSCAYALGIQEIYSTHQWTTVPGMEINAVQGVQGLKLCDTIVGDGHVVMITDIVRNTAGEVVQVTVSEAAGVDVKRTNYTAATLTKKWPTSKYTYCRYTRIAEVEYTASEYVSVGDEGAKEVVYNTAIIPRKGDRANWLMGTDVVVDVLEPKGYAEVRIFRDGAPYQTLHFTQLEVCDTGYVMTLKDLPHGTYSAYLSGPNGDSMTCYWMVVAAQSNATLTEDGMVRIDFSALNAEPLYVHWMNGTHNGTIHIDPLTDEQRAAGTVTLPPASNCFKVRVAFKTEYGVVFATLPQDSITIM